MTDDSTKSRRVESRGRKTKGKKMCCKIDCQEQAEWTIVDGMRPDDYTEACTAHVGDLLSDASEHRVYPIQK